MVASILEQKMYNLNLTQEVNKTTMLYILLYQVLMPMPSIPELTTKRQINQLLIKLNQAVPQLVLVYTLKMKLELTQLENSQENHPRVKMIMSEA